MTDTESQNPSSDSSEPSAPPPPPAGVDPEPLAESSEPESPPSPEPLESELPELGVPPEVSPPPPPRRGCGCLGFLILFLLTLAAGGAAGFFYLQNWADRPQGAPAEHTFKILPHTPTRAIARALRGEGLIDNDLLFVGWLRLQTERHPLQAGEYRLKTPIAPHALAEVFRHGSFERSLTVPEGWTAPQIAERLKKERWIADEREWLDLVARPAGPEAAGVPLPRGAEGFCFPETYRLATSARPEELLKRMMARFRYEWDRLSPARRDPRSADLATTQVVVLASMIEREARTEAEMPRIASVYLNRIKKGMKLQCCATVRYALGGVWDRPLLYSDLKTSSPYNTYLNPGLPPGPIANPGRAALAAVLRPAPTDDLFYVYAGNNQHIYSRTYAEHMRAVRAARARHPKETIPEQDDPM